jgi:hypothetical protein
MTRFVAHCDTAHTCYTHARTLVSTVTSSLPLLGSSIQRRTFSFLWVPEVSPASATSFSKQQLTTTGPQQSSYWLSDGQSANLSWCLATSGAQDQIFVTVRQLRVCSCGAPTLTRGRACRLQTQLVLANAIIFTAVKISSTYHLYFNYTCWHST